MLTNSRKDALHSTHEVDIKGGSGESLRTVCIRITFGVVGSLDVTPESSKVVLEIVFLSGVRLVANSFADIDGITICEVIVDRWGGTVT